MTIATAIAHNEGMLDAARLLDSGLTSSGFEQWTTADNDEGTVLLAEHARLDPDQHDLHFRMAGLDVTVLGSWPDGTPASASLVQLSPGDPPTSLPMAPEPQHLREQFFGGTRTKTPANVTLVSFDPQWSARPPRRLDHFACVRGGPVRGGG